MAWRPVCKMRPAILTALLFSSTWSHAEPFVATVAQSTRSSCFWYRIPCNVHSFSVPNLRTRRIVTLFVGSSSFPKTRKLLKPQAQCEQLRTIFWDVPSFAGLPLCQMRSLFGCTILTAHHLNQHIFPFRDECWRSFRTVLR